MDQALDQLDRARKLLRHEACECASVGRTETAALQNKPGTTRSRAAWVRQQRARTRLAG